MEIEVPLCTMFSDLIHIIYSEQSGVIKLSFYTLNPETDENEYMFTVTTTVKVLDNAGLIINKEVFKAIDRRKKIDPMIT